MKKISIFFVLFVVFILTIKVQAADELCTGPIYTDANASQACAALAETQGKARGYDITCKSVQMGLPYEDPNTGLRYYFDATCTVNGYEGQGAQLLAGYTGFTGEISTGRYLTWSSAVPGWDTLAINLKSFEAVKMCGGYNYAVNSSGVYYCLPSSTPTTQTPTTQTPTTSNVNTSAGNQTTTYIQNLVSTINNLVQKYKNLNGLNTFSPTTNTTTNTSANTTTTGVNSSLITVNADALNIRQAPNTQASVLGQLKAGETFTAVCYVIGENVEGTSRWWKTSSGSYVWAGGTVGQPSSANTLCGSNTTTGSTSQTTSNTMSGFDAWVSANGSRTGTIAAVGETISYAWSSNGAISASSDYTADAPDNCPGGILSQGEVKPWIASTLYGNSSATVQECQAWRTYTINYKVKNASGGELTKSITAKTFPRCTGAIYTNATASQDCAALTQKIGTALGKNITCASKQVGMPFADANTGLNYYYDATCTMDGVGGLGAQLLAGYEGFSGPVNNRSLSWNSNSSTWNNYVSLSQPVSSVQVTTSSVSDARIQQIITQANVLQYSSLTSDEKNALYAYLSANGSALINQNFQTFAPGSVFAWALGMGTETTLNAAAKSLGFTTLNPLTVMFVKTPGYTIQ